MKILNEPRPKTNLSKKKKQIKRGFNELKYRFFK